MSVHAHGCQGTIAMELLYDQWNWVVRLFCIVPPLLIYFASQVSSAIIYWIITLTWVTCSFMYPPLYSLTHQQNYRSVMKKSRFRSLTIIPSLFWTDPPEASLGNGALFPAGSLDSDIHFVSYLWTTCEIYRLILSIYLKVWEGGKGPGWDPPPTNPLPRTLSGRPCPGSSLGF